MSYVKLRIVAIPFNQTKYVFWLRMECEQWTSLEVVQTEFVQLHLSEIAERRDNEYTFTKVFQTYLLFKKRFRLR